MLEPVAFTAAYDSVTNTVTLTLTGKPNFRDWRPDLGDCIAAGRCCECSGCAAHASDTRFTILPKAKGIRGRV